MWGGLAEVEVVAVAEGEAVEHGNQKEQLLQGCRVGQSRRSTIVVAGRDTSRWSFLCVEYSLLLMNTRLGATRHSV